MKKKTQRGIWETDVHTLDLNNPGVLRFYVERKIQAGDWEALTKTMVAKVIAHITIDPHVKTLLKDFLFSHGSSHRRASRSSHCRRKKRA